MPRDMQCARFFDSFTNACSVVVQLKTPDGKVHGWPMGFYGFLVVGILA